jgi:hypothetical protein
MTALCVDVQIEQIDINEIRVEINALSDAERESIIQYVLDELSSSLGVDLRDPETASRTFTVLGDDGESQPF